jgi:PAS domain S-box-containing protein
MSTLSENALFPYYQKVTEQANTVAKRAVLAFFLIGVLLAAFHSTWIAALAVGFFLLGMFFLPSALGNYNRYLNSIVLAAFTILFHYQLQGLQASHFFFFIVLTILLFYEDWRVLLPSSVLHLLFISILYFKADEAWVKPFLIQEGNVLLGDYLLHICIVTAYTSLCAVWSELQHRQTRESAQQASLMKEQLSLIESNQQFAESISQGNLKVEYPSAQPDSLGQSLLAMRSSLVEANVREERERFMTTGQATIGELLRVHVNDLQKLCDEVLSEIITYMKANQGSIFTIEDAGNKNEHLKLRSARAWERKKFLEKRIEMGQGLVGQAAIEKSTIYMTDIPENYVTITSGLGAANPRSIIIVPLKNEEKIVGVLEMASFKKFEPYEIQFLEKIGESIASTMLNSRNNERNRELLQQSGMMTEQMRAQEEEMRQNLEEMQATQEEMTRTQKMLADQAKEVSVKQNNLNALINATSDSIIAMSKDYKIIVMNDTLRKRYKGTQYEGLAEGADALQTLGAVRDEWKGYYDRALKGEHLQFVLKSSVKGEDSFREYFINPMINTNNDVFGLSVVSRDVTERHRAEGETSKRGFIINALINFTNDTYFAIDKEYKILIANTVLRERFKASGIDLHEGKQITDVLSEDAKKVWQPRYDKALAGERLHFTEERKVGETTLYLEVFVEPIFNDKQEVIGCAVVSRDITEQKRAMDKAALLEAELVVKKIRF